MKRIIVLSIAALLSAPVLAKGHMHEDMPGKMVERMAENLNLTDDQKVQVSDIFEDTRKKMKTLKSEADESIQAILSSEQKVKFEQMKQSRKEKKERIKEHHQ